MKSFTIELNINGNTNGDFDQISLDYFKISTNFKPFANLKILELVESFITANRSFEVLSRQLDPDNEFCIGFSMADMPSIDTGKHLYEEISALDEKITSLFPHKFYLDEMTITYSLYTYFFD